VPGVSYNSDNRGFLVLDRPPVAIAIDHEEVVIMGSNIRVSETEAWGDPEHAKVFDYMHGMPDYILKKHYESFSEGRLLKNFVPLSRKGKLYEVGCATGELYRYLRNNRSDLSYQGFDISEPAIDRARQKYPDGNFYKVTDGFDEILQKYDRPEVVWCRDVLLHQEDPFTFLDNLIKLAKEAVIVRLRTRDIGATELNTEISCQLHWDKFWVPYIVLNTDEMIRKIEAHSDVSKVTICRSYEVLGGHNFRVLPKDLYFTATGTAETALFIQKGPRAITGFDVSYQDPGKSDRPQYTLAERALRRVLNMVKGWRIHREM
jgi:2-polyprenyl-3-methyl-5-hydroxy-6-metoxy-1,4-benzoquinol methylase